MNIIKQSFAFFSAHPMLNSIAHAAGGFGLAILLQHYLKGNAFLPAWIGWALVLVSVALHVQSFMSK